MSSYAEPTAAEVRCPVCHKLFPGYHDLFHCERVVRAACILHGHPVVERRYTGTAKSNWGTVGHGPQDGSKAETEEAETVTPTPAELDRAEREALEEMRAGDAQEA